MLITKEMYERAKEVEEAEARLYELEYWDDYTEEYIEWETLYDNFYKDFKLNKFRVRNQTSTIIKKYERKLNK